MSIPRYFDPNLLPYPTDPIVADVCVYGGTAAGVLSARTLSEYGRSVALVNPAARLGGMTTHGLGCTDVGNPEIIGGMSRRFYEALGLHYGKSLAWRFEPHVAQTVIDRFADHPLIQIIHNGFVDACLIGSGGPGGGAGTIQEITLVGGQRIQAQFFIDASYEGDLFARAGVPFRLGREPAGAFGESLAGIQISRHHQFHQPVSPWRVTAEPTSGLLDGIEPGLWTKESLSALTGMGDSRVQAYNFRLCMTEKDENRIPFRRPVDYSPDRYTLAARWLQVTEEDVFWKFDRIPGGKTDTNNHGAFSSDFIGKSSLWPGADYDSRERIFQEHLSYHQGLLYFMANDASIPSAIRAEFSRWGLAADEFTETQNWPAQLYVREARRMIGVETITEHHCRGNVDNGTPIAMGAYQMDSHNCRRIVVDGFVKNEGDVQMQLDRPYGIPFGSVLPARGTVSNLTVPVALSATHIAFGSVRMEPVFMMLAEAASVIAHVSLSRKCSVQDIPYGVVAEELIKRGQILSANVENTPGKQNAEDWTG